MNCKRCSRVIEKGEEYFRPPSGGFAHGNCRKDPVKTMDIYIREPCGECKGRGTLLNVSGDPQDVREECFVCHGNKFIKRWLSLELLGVRLFTVFLQDLKVHLEAEASRQEGKNT